MDNRKVTILVCLILMIGFFGGFVLGTTQGIKTCVDIGLRFLKNQGIKIEVDSKELTQAIERYSNNIKSDYPLGLKG